MKLVSDKDICEDKWRKLLMESRFSSPFQTIESHRLFSKTDGFSANVFAIEKNDEYLSLVVVTIQQEAGVKAFFSKRGIIYGGPLVKNEGESLKMLLNGVKDYYRKKLIFIEIRNNFDTISFSEEFTASGFVYEPHLNVQLDVQDKNLDDILSKMKYNRRREVRISWKEGAICRFAENENEIVELYEMLKAMYAERVKKPVGPLSYFMNLYKSEIGKVFVVYHEGNLIGGSFCTFDNQAIYTLYYTGLRFYNKKIFPTHLAIMKIIEFAIENNMKIVDFMGAGKPGEEYGVRDFKLQFGGDLVEHGRYKLINNPTLYNLGVFGLKMLSKIK